MLIALPGVLDVDVMARQRPAGTDEVTRLGERTTRQRTLTRLRSSMLDLRVFGESGVMARAAERLDVVAGTAGVRVVDAARPGSSVVRADVALDSVGEVLDELERLAVPPADISLARIELVGQLAKRKPNTTWWVAGSNARLVGQYLAFMAVAGVIGCYRVVDRNPILIVAAMAVSPDLLPITAIAGARSAAISSSPCARC
jgi:hypothetical protein